MMKTKTTTADTTLSVLKDGDSMATEAQRKAIKNYKKKVNRLGLEFSPAEQELWEHIQAQTNKQGYIKSLIRADLKTQASE